jgi:hypothetical protein
MKAQANHMLYLLFIPCIKLMNEREATEVAEHGEVLRWSEDEAKIPELFVKGHGNLGKIVANFFETVLHVGIVTEVIPRRKGYYYKVTYGDGDQEDMDEAELMYAIELKDKKDAGEDLTNEAEGNEVLSGLSEEGSVYDSEEDKKALKEARKKRKAVAQVEKPCSKKKTIAKTKRAVCPDSVANIGGPDSNYFLTLIVCMSSLPYLRLTHGLVWTRPS